MSRVPVRCRDCGIGCKPGPRCNDCKVIYEFKRNNDPKRKDYHDPAYLTFEPSGLCSICGKPGSPEDPLTRGHTVPVSKGGTAAAHGLTAQHRSCNARLGARIHASIERNRTLLDRLGNR